MRSDPIILKLGGSVVTEKDKDLTPNLGVIKRLSQEVSNANISPVILIHGGGSFGHPLAKKYRIAEGFRDQSQLLGFSETHEAMVSLNKIIVSALKDERVAAFGMAPSSFIVTRNGRIQSIAEEPLRRAIEVGLTPVLYGDAVLDYEKGFAILSGDQIAAVLALRMHAKKIIMGVDVNGLYTSDPKADSSACLVSHLTLRDLERLKSSIGGTSVTDVTGGMAGKVLELMTPISHGVKVIVVNALRPGNVYRAMRGEEDLGTRITKE